MLYRSEDEIPVSVSALGLDWAIRQLELVTSQPDGRPPADIEKLESAILDDLDAFRRQTYKSRPEKTSKLGHAISFIGYAVLRKNSKLWNKTFPHLLSADPFTVECILLEAFEIFEFGSLKPG